jgi:hypothetical protein
LFDSFSILVFKPADPVFEIFTAQSFTGTTLSGRPIPLYQGRTQLDDRHLDGRFEDSVSAIPEDHP